MDWVIDDHGRVLSSLDSGNWFIWFLVGEPVGAFRLDHPVLLWPGAGRYVGGMAVFLSREGVIEEVVPLRRLAPRVRFGNGSVLVLPKKMVGHFPAVLGLRLRFR